MAHSTEPNLKKILLDITEYDRLKHIEAEYISLQKLHQQQNSNSSTSNQFGKGHYKSIISSTSKEEDVSNFSNQQIGDGEPEELHHDVVPQFAKAAEKNINHLPPSLFDVKLFKNDLNTAFDEQKLLALIQKSHVKNAKILLKEFDKRTNELTWNSSGVLFINQTSIPQSNIYLLFPLLFKKKANSLPGFKELLEKIYDMGLDDLIVTTAPKKHYEPNEITTFGQGNHLSAVEPEKSAPWWYIGD